MFDDNTQTFIEQKDCDITLEHSLLSISKWESKWKKPFLSSSKTQEEVIDYIKCMTITKGVSSNIYYMLTEKNINDIQKYIEDPMTATTFSKNNLTEHNRDIITSEIIYYWMISLNIPIEFEKWHINRLLTLIRICNIKNAPPKKMSAHDIMSRNSALNAARRKKMNSKG